MTRNITDARLSLLSEFVARYFGLYFPQQRWLDLERGVYAAAKECGSHCDVESYIQGLLSSVLTQDQLEVLASHLTVGETYFFREKRALEVLAGHIVPELIAAHVGLGRQIRIWSAGCATGEEPYSVAIVLSELMAGLKAGDVQVLATDLNTKSLRRASQGSYSEWSFRDTPAWVRHNYFEAAEGGRRVILPAIKKIVAFTPLNLMDDIYPPLSNCANGVDVIFCRNVLMYFTPEGIRKVIQKFYQCLAADGWLIVSPAETSHELFSDFAAVSFGDVTLYRKSDKRLMATRALPLRDEEASSVQQSAWIVETADTLGTSGCQLNQNVRNTEAGPVSVELPPASYAQALRLYEQGTYEQASQTAMALLSQNESDAEAMCLLARIHANQGKLAEALAWCDKAIAANKMAAHAYYLRATILQEQSSIAEAILALKQAVCAEPQFALGHFALGNLTLQHGRPKESEKHFENVLLLLAQYDPEDIVPESEGLSAGRLREMIVAPSTFRVATRTSQRRIRAASRLAMRTERTIVR